MRTHRAHTWRFRAAECARQEPLVDTRLSLSSLERVGPSRPPRAVYVGIGLCFPDSLSRAVPVDLLGMLLPAEAIRRAIDADRLVVLVADRHARENGFSAVAVESRARMIEAVLLRIRERCHVEALTPIRASELHTEPDYRRTLDRLERRAPLRLHGYERRQVADAICLDRRFGGVLKVGWALRGAGPERRRDEVAFDRELRRVAGERIGFVYCKPGRSLADAAPRMPPYSVRRPEARLCLDRDDDPAAKLGAAQTRASVSTVRACRRHLRSLAYTFDRHVGPLPRGPLEARLGALLARVGPGRGRSRPDPEVARPAPAS